MIPLLLFIVPLLGAIVTFLSGRNSRIPKVMLEIVAINAMILSCCGLTLSEIRGITGWLEYDDGPNRLLVFVTSLLFMLVTQYVMVWITAEEKEGEVNYRKIRIFCGCLQGFLCTMLLVLLAQNIGLLWVAVEATTLISAPLIMFYHKRSSIEAMWKYLIICSVGIGLALFGTMLLIVASRDTGAGLNLGRLLQASRLIHPGWYKAAFVFILAGYGTKMGLAPFHTWLPDAHSEAPGAASALLSGALLNCSFVGIMRIASLAPAETTRFVSLTLVALGLLSLAVAACFIIRQTDFKRMLAYSSVEHMGILALCLSCGAMSVSYIHIIGHSLIKMALFLLAGNFLYACGTRQISLLGGLVKRLPMNSWLWFTGILLVCGVPPSPLFCSEFLLLFHCNYLLAVAVVILLFIIFAGMTSAALRMIAGEPGEIEPSAEKIKMAERLTMIPLTAQILAVALGIFFLVICAWEM